LFKPFIYSRLDAMGLSATVKQAKKLVEKERPEVWDILDEVIREHPVMLNRAPKLHRLGIQAFEPKLIEGKAIQLHPLVCTAFNADFDGDQMAVHVPLSLEAQLEARVLMMSTNNILSPANGKPIIVPSQDIVLGLYYITLEKEGEPGEGMVFSNVDEIEHALDAGAVTLHAKVKAVWRSVDAEGNETMELVETTPGRMKVASVLPKDHNVPFDVVNTLLRKKTIQGLIDTVYRHCGQKKTVIFADHIMELGFKEACKAGISFGKDDMVIPDTKAGIVDETRSLASEYEQQYADGLITRGEKYNKVVDAWAKCTDRVAEEMMKEISTTKFDPETKRQLEPNSVYMMSHSGARGSPTQMRQLAAMRGLMAKPSGEIIETPIVSNFKEGLTVLEYFNSTHGARKGLADTALKTANSGYLTRRLVDVAQDCIVKEMDCGTTQGITLEAIVDSGEIVLALSERLLGRTVLGDIADPDSGEVMVEDGTLLDEVTAEAIERAGIQKVKVRSPLTCETPIGVCAKCYGRDLARGEPVNVGEAVGVIAAQSIGEPGTQLTMRTFHVGGTAQVGDTSLIEASHEGTIHLENRNVVKDSAGDLVVMGRNTLIKIRGIDGQDLASFKVIYGTKLRVDDGDTVERGQRLADWDPYTLPIMTEGKGKVRYEDLVESVSVQMVADEETGLASRVVTDWRSNPRGGDLRPAILIVDNEGEPIKLESGQEARTLLPVEAILSVDDGAEVGPGDVLARIPTEGAKTKDITGGLPRVAELFEARRPKDHAIIAEIDGRVEFGRDYKNKRRLSIVPADDSLEPVEYLVPKGKHLAVQEGDFIAKGEYILDGNPAPHDILDVLGIEALADYLINEIQEVYRLQGVPINDKHIEVIVRQMLQKVEVKDPGDSPFLKDEQVDKVEFDEINVVLEEQGSKPAVGDPVLLGITKASLQTRSFISAASFQETTRVLTEAAVQGKIDTLEGLKENVIVGRLIPAGTGGQMTKHQIEADKRDQQLIEEREVREAAALPAPDQSSGGDIAAAE
ncbi:MAG: DNA-directed RNA polymerase subunit beta', partial [Pseudomonadota bacterium]